jgi:Ca2+-transporting ATPase
MTPHWHTQPVDAVLKTWSTAESGLAAEAAAERLQTHGPNELRERRGKGPWRMLAGQFTETMVLILILAGVLSAFLGKLTETTAILAIVILFGVLGFIQEHRAERAMVALRQLAVPAVRVRRDGQVGEVPACELVPGDIVLLEAGNAVPADLRLVEAVQLKIQEAALTGESEPIEKNVEAIPDPGLPLGDRRNMAYLGTSVTFGRGRGVVVATGMHTELGRVATLIQDVAPQRTPLQRRLDQLARTLAAAGALAAALVAAGGWWSGEPLADMFLTAVSVAVAVVPEGLPAVVTITLALGAQRMLRRNALIRKLPAVETLGAVTVICSDKTGTLTENRMTVTVVDAAGERLDLMETLRRSRPSVTAAECRTSAAWDVPAPIRLALAAGALCNDAVLRADAGPGCFSAIGDPTEGALLVAAARTGVMPDRLQAAAPRVAEVPFDSNRKRMTTVHRWAGDIPDALLPFKEAELAAFTKGASDGLLSLATEVWTAARPEPLTQAWRDRIHAASERLARDGMRVLGVAFRPLRAPVDSINAELLERDLTFLGLIGLMDPPRAAVRPAVATCRAAGIRPVMITGDHPLTAGAIARDLGMAGSPEAVTGEALNRMGPSELAAIVEEVSVFARVSPEDKLRIVDALKQRGQVVAMTGDGVNDAPALRKADIGVAMGITGTDVAKEAADMVLVDDNFATIVDAVAEGRTIYANLMRFVKFSLGGNLGKVLVMLAAPLFGIHVALRPLQLLWLNLLTDGLMGLGLGVEPAEADAMQRPPRPPDAPVLDTAAKVHIGWAGAVMAVAALGLGAAYFEPLQPEDTTWQTMIFAALGFTQIGHALGLRASGHPGFAVAANPLMAVLTLATLVLQLAAIYLPFLERFFGLVPLAWEDLGLAFAMGVLTWAGVKIERAFLRGRKKTAAGTAGGDLMNLQRPEN